MLHAHHFRLTQEREALLDTFIESGRMLTPGQLFDLQTVQPHQVGLTTVYRLLEVLTKLNLATPILIDGEIFYIFCSDQHHHHFVCLDCHRVQDLFTCPVSVDHPEHYGTVKYHRVDLYGRCARCEQEGSD